MKCGQAEKWMDAVLDEQSGGAASGAPGSQGQRQREFEAHLAACPTCRRQWEALRSAEAVLRVPKPVPAPESLLADFRRRLAEEEQRSAPLAPPVPRRAGWRWAWPLSSLAAAGVAAAAVLMFNLQPPLSSIQEIQGQREAPHAVETPGRPSFPKQRDPGTDRAAAARSKLLPVPPGSDGSRAQQPEPRIAGKPKVEKPLSRPSSLAAAGADTRWHFQGSAEGKIDHLARLKQVPRGSNGLGLQPVGPQAPKPSTDFALAEREGAHPASPTPLDVTPGKSSQSEARLEDGDRSAKNNARPQGDVVVNLQKQVTTNAGLSTGQVAPVKSQSLNYLYSNNAAQFTQQAAQSGNIYYAQVPVEPTPVELNVSAAVLNALQRPVELRGSNVQVQALAEQLATEADVELKVDPKIAQMSVSVNEAGVPLWRVLEDVARQTQTEIYPRENSLVLRPPAPAEPGAERGRSDSKLDVAAKARTDGPVRSRGLQLAPKVVTEAIPPPPAPAAPAAPARPRGPAGPVGRRGLAGAPSGGFGGGAGLGGFGGGLAAPEAETKPRPEGSARYAFSSRQPDRKVWPAAWGNLPERGFEVPTADELPPLVLTPVQVGTTLSNEVPQVRARVERLSRKRPEAGEKAAAAKAKKKPAPAKARK